MIKNLALAVLLIGLILAGYFLMTDKGGVVNEVTLKSDLIQVSQPVPNMSITSPVTIVGEARGFWYFEASFPIEVVDYNGNVLGTGIAQAQGEWMTENFVPFETKITFVKPEGVKSGKIILRKDNPSGLPEHDDSLEIPIRFE